MSLLHYIDNEVPWNGGYGEWDSRAEAGSSTVTRTEAASFPERGFSKHGLTVHVVGSDDCYMRKDFAAETSPLNFGFWFMIPATPTWSNGNTIALTDGRNATNGTNSWTIYLRNDGGAMTLRVFARAGAGSTHATGGTLVTGRWYYIALDCEWTVAHAYAQLYLDGVSVAIAEAVADASTNKPEYAQFGSDWSTAGVDATYYIDEVKIRDDSTYAEPYVPTPSSDYPCPERTAVLWRGASDDSRQFADYCVSQLGIPRCNLLRLDDAAADETLATAALFNTQIEDPWVAYILNNPSIGVNVRCFLLGYGVPGYFMDGGVKHSGTSRMMNLTAAFSSGTANALYNPDPVVRLGSGDLGGKYLATRIDADTLQHAKDIVDAGLAVTALAELTDADTLYSDDAAYLASLNCQHLRCLFEMAALGAYADDAFVWGDTGDPTFDAAGSRAHFTDDSASSADTLRANSSACGEALIDAGYAAALGNSETADTFDADSFFEMLRIGGTLAEAFAVAIAKLDYTSVAVGVPFMTAAFQLAGYNIYRGIGGPEHMDWENPVTYARSDQQTVSLAQTLVPGQHYLYAVRVVSKAGLVERNTHVLTYVGVDEEGYLLPPPLARPSDLAATVLTDGALVIGFSYLRQLGFAEADGFDVLSDHGTGQLDLESPVASIDQVRPGQRDFEVSISRPSASVQLAVRARNGERVGPLSEVLFVPLSCPPALAKVL